MSNVTELDSQKVKNAALLAESREISKAEQKAAAIAAEEHAEKAVEAGADAKLAEAGAKVVSVLVKVVPNNGLLTLNNVQIRIPAMNDKMKVPYSFYAAFPQYFALLD